VHKTANVLNKLPKSQQSKAKRALQEIWMAETRKDALAAFDIFGRSCAAADAATVKPPSPAFVRFYRFPRYFSPGRPRFPGGPGSGWKGDPIAARPSGRNVTGKKAAGAEASGQSGNRLGVNDD
jgi:hypothetical protein